jgi:hypothetical protein
VREKKEYPDNWGVKFYPNGETPEQALTRHERKKRVPRQVRRRASARRTRKRY